MTFLHPIIVATDCKARRFKQQNDTVRWLLAASKSVKQYSRNSGHSQIINYSLLYTLIVINDVKVGVTELQAGWLPTILASQEMVDVEKH